MGVVKPVTASEFFELNDKNFSQRIKSSTESDEMAKKLSRIMAKKRKTNPDWKNSNAYKRIKKKYNKEISSATNKKNWIRHNISSQLVNNPNYDTIVFEDLNLKNMTKRSAKGISNRKSGLNRVLQNTGLGEIRNQVKYKSEWYGKNVVLVDPKYTSQKCSKCGHIQKENRVTQSNFTCIVCGHHENADLNAAKNIKEKYFQNIL
jgi:putative transposase